MYTIISLLLFAAVAEFLRRCCMVLLTAFTGPLAKIPGPLIYKLSSLPWVVENITGNQMNVGPGLFKKYGDIVRVTPRSVLVAEKSAILKILVDEDFRKSPDYEAIREDYKITSLISETDKIKYKHRRRILSPGFSISYLNGLEPLVQECVGVMSKVLDARCKNGNGCAVVDVSKMFANLTSDIMGATSFGGSFNLVESDDATLKNMFTKRLQRAAIDSQFPFVKFLPFVPPSSADHINTMIDDIVARRRKENKEKGVTKKDLVQIFIDNNDADPERFTHKHIQEEMVLFMIAGSDTTAITDTFTLVLLLNHPKKLKILLAEIDSEFPSRYDSITYAKTQELPYLNAVLNESMRVMPIVVAGLARLVTQPTVLCNHEVPAGTVVSAYLSAMMVDPRIWPDAKSFIPERWIEPYKGIEADKKAFIPFSAGSRNCPGQQFALKNLRLTLAMLLHRYELTLIPGQSHEMRVHTTPWFKQGFYNVGFKPRV